MFLTEGLIKDDVIKYNMDLLEDTNILFLLYEGSTIIYPDIVKEIVKEKLNLDIDYENIKDIEIELRYKLYHTSKIYNRNEYNKIFNQIIKSHITKNKLNVFYLPMNFYGFNFLRNIPMMIINESFLKSFMKKYNLNKEFKYSFMDIDKIPKKYFIKHKKDLKFYHISDNNKLKN